MPKYTKMSKLWDLSRFYFPSCFRSVGMENSLTWQPKAACGAVPVLGGSVKHRDAQTKMVKPWNPRTTEPFTFLAGLLFFGYHLGWRKDRMGFGLVLGDFLR